MRILFTVLLIACLHTGWSQKTPNKDSLVVPALAFDSAGKLIIIPSLSSARTDFNFFEGKWILHNRLLKVLPDKSKSWQEFEATQEMHVILHGTGNSDNFLATRDGQPFEGMTLRLFNPETRLWSIYWADSKYGILYLPPVVGSFNKKVGHFFSQDIINDKRVITVYRWDARQTDHPVWSQATSADNGENWEWNWYMYFSRIKK